MREVAGVAAPREALVAQSREPGILLPGKNHCISLGPDRNRQAARSTLPCEPCRNKKKGESTDRGKDQFSM